MSWHATHALRPSSCRQQHLVEHLARRPGNPVALLSESARLELAYRDLRNLTARAVGRLGDKFNSLDRRIEAYRDEPVQDWRAHDLIIRTVGCRAITTSQVPDVVQEWREPSHREFRPRNLWSLFLWTAAF